MAKEISIVWFRQDLRLSDNPALTEAVQAGKILPIYILDDCAPKPFNIGGASKAWLHHSLENFNKSLGGQLNIYAGKTSEVIESLLQQYGVKNIFWNKCYEPWQVKQEKDVKTLCKGNDIRCHEFNGNYLWSPNEVLKDDGHYYKVFTPYKKRAYLCPPRKTVYVQDKPQCIKDEKNSISIADLNLLPKKLNWHQQMLKHWEIGEIAAQKKLDAFIANALSGYKEGRDFPGQNQTSLLSPHLHFGEISPAQIWESIDRVEGPDQEHFLSEVVWREFSCYLLYHFKRLHADNFNAKFNLFPWKDNASHLKAWQTGNTGYPIVDAGMRELWQTGYMHNRVRMIVASFLVKNLTIHWHRGRDWFWDCLVDADLANNSASWQWVAGSGADAAPYFRIFNPVTQGEKFDKHGDYTRKYVPELKDLPDKYLFKPWTAPDEVLRAAGIELGENYPKPIVDLAASREKALDAYQTLR
ncbi:MAG: deoxyribodipyrimidine photo-lyase [Chlamydiota bacterium]|nr:deoxyribodipyrimidine photo-lyase [Chlamydiota bacterium]